MDHRSGLQLGEAERRGASCSLVTGVTQASFLCRACTFILHPCPFPLPSLLPPEEVQLEGDRARSSAGADRTKVNMPAIAAASGLWTDDGRWAGEDHTHKALWTTQAPACLPACLRHTLARRGIHGMPSHHPWGPTAPQMPGDILLKYPVISKLFRGTEDEDQVMGARTDILSPFRASVSLFRLGSSTGWVAGAFWVLLLIHGSVLPYST